MFLATLYFVLPLLGKSRPPLAFLSAESSWRVLEAAPRPPPKKKLRRGRGGCGTAKFRFGEGDPESSALRAWGWGRGPAALARSVSSLVFVSYVFNDLAWREIKASEPSSPKPDAPCKCWGACGGAGGRWGVDEHRARRANLEGKTFPGIASRCSPPGGPGIRARPLRVQLPARRRSPLPTAPGLQSGRAERVAGAGDGGRAALEAEQPLKLVGPGAAGPARAVGSVGSRANREKPAKPRDAPGVGWGETSGRRCPGGKMDSQA